MKRILLIDFYFSTDNVGGLRWRKFAKHLPGEDIYPVILTSGVFRGLSLVNNLNVFCVPFPFKTDVSCAFASGWDDSLWGRVKRFARGNFFIPDPRRLWFCYGLAKDLINRFSIDTVITTGPPHSVHLTGLRLKRNLGVKWIADFRDPWIPFYHNKFYPTKFTDFLQRYYEWEVLSSADAIIAVEEGLTEQTHIISNCFDPEDFKYEVNPSGEMVYIGSPYPGINKSFKIINGISHSDACMEMMKAGTLINYCPGDIIPAKTYEYIASGRPVVNVGCEGKAYHLLYKCGVLAYLKRNEDEIQKYSVVNVVKNLTKVINAV